MWYQRKVMIIQTLIIATSFFLEPSAVQWKYLIYIYIYIYIRTYIYRLLISRITNHKNQQMMNDIKSIGPLIDKQKNVSVHVKIDLKELKEAVGMINCSIRWKETKVQAEEYTERSKSYWKQTVTEDNPWPWKQWRYQNEK